MIGIPVSDIQTIWAPIYKLALTVNLVEYSRRDPILCVSQNRQRKNGR